VTAERPNLRLLPTEKPGPLPNLTEWKGRRLEWQPWVRREMFICPPEAAKCECGYAGASWLTFGIAHPRPGETERRIVTQESRRHPGQFFDIDREVPVRPVKAIAGFRCPACRRTDLYERNGFNLEPIDPQPSLFELEDTP